MRLEEWFKHLESFDHTVEQAAEDAGMSRSDESASSNSTSDGSDARLPGGTARFIQVPDRSSAFRAVPAPESTRIAGQNTVRGGEPAGRVARPNPLPAQKESRDQLLARLLDPVLTLEEAAQVLNVCPTTVRRYTNKGLLQHYRTSGNQRRFRLSHVLNFLGESGGSLDKGTLIQTGSSSSRERAFRGQDRVAK